MIEQYIGTLEEGVADGRTSAITPVRRAIEQIDRLLAMTPADHPAVSMAQVADDERERLVAAVEEHIYPTLRRLRDYLAQDYEQHARPEPGLEHDARRRGSLPARHPHPDLARRDCRGGPRLRPRRPRVDRVREGRDRAPARPCRPPRPSRGAARGPRQPHRRSGARSCGSPQEQTDRAYAAAPNYFGRLPSANCYVKAVEAYREAESPPAFYMPPSLDGSRQAQYYINTYQPAERQLHKIASITFHEATPGHHFQIAIEMELQGLPRVPDPWRAAGRRVIRRGLGPVHRAARRRDGPLRRRSRAASACSRRSPSAPRGWSSTPASTPWAGPASRRSTSCTSAARCRWSTPRSRSTATRSGRARRSRTSSASARSSAPRAAVSEQMGDRFDLRAFHDEVLGHGSLPLATLTPRDRHLGGGGGHGRRLKLSAPPTTGRSRGRAAPPPAAASPARSAG